MLKISEKVKEFEIEALEAVHALLELVPILKVHPVEHEKQIGPDHRIDGVIRLSNADKEYALVIEVKNQGQPRFVRSAIYQLRNYVVNIDRTRFGTETSDLVPLLVTPYLSPESRRLCIEHNVSYLDLFGNFRLAFGTVFFERTVGEKPKSETRSLRSIFSPKASAILRVMLSHPGEPWRVTQLAEEANASLGHVSNVRKALLEREWAEEQDEGVVLTKPMQIIETWRENYRRPAGHRRAGHTHFHGSKLDDRVREALSVHEHGPRAVCSLHSAAKWISPFVRDATNTFYADEEGAEYLSHTLRLSPTSKGANVIITIVKDKSLFDDAVEPVSSIFCTSPIQTYLDLWVGNDRDREAAEYLFEKNFQWRH